MIQDESRTRPFPEEAGPAKPSAPARPARAPKPRRSGGAGWIILAMVLFSLAYGGILLVKIQQEREALVTEAERSQANAAGYLAERVTGRLAEARYALAFASADLRNTPASRQKSPPVETPIWFWRFRPS